MKTMLLAASAAALTLSAGLFTATASSAAPAAGPKQPIPYSELSAYMKASPKTRASKDWWSGQQASNSSMPNTGAATGSAANTSATAPSPSPSLPSDTSTTSTANPTSEAAPQLPSGPVNPPTAATTPGAPDPTTPPK